MASEGLLVPVRPTALSYSTEYAITGAGIGLGTVQGPHCSFLRHTVTVWKAATRLSIVGGNRRAAQGQWLLQPRLRRLRHEA